VLCLGDCLGDIGDFSLSCVVMPLIAHPKTSYPCCQRILPSVAWYTLLNCWCFQLLKFNWRPINTNQQFSCEDDNGRWWNFKYRRQWQRQWRPIVVKGTVWFCYFSHHFSYISKLTNLFFISFIILMFPLLDAHAIGCSLDALVVLVVLAWRWPRTCPSRRSAWCYFMLWNQQFVHWKIF
jgi:hypothetical protein